MQYLNIYFGKSTNMLYDLVNQKEILLKYNRSDSQMQIL